MSDIIIIVSVLFGLLLVGVFVFKAFPQEEEVRNDYVDEVDETRRYSKEYKKKTKGKK